MLREDEFQSKVLAEYHGCSNEILSQKTSGKSAGSTATANIIRSNSSTLMQQEENHLKRVCTQYRPRRNPIAAAMIAENYRIHLKLSLLKGVSSITLLSITANPPPSFLDHLLSSHQHSRNEQQKENRIESGISSRIVLVTMSFCKESMSEFFPNKNIPNKNIPNKNIPANTFNTENNYGKVSHNNQQNETVRVTVTDVAQNGFIYHGHRFRFLLSKEPKDKISYFIRDDCSHGMFPDASSVRNYIADFSSQPTIFRAGVNIVLCYVVL